ncbi:MAG: metallophosphoesterase family protein [Lachnospiraceae bacterium]|nr:metallophosphoesterase family protein [Lachnospiraceae bacterium]
MKILVVSDHESRKIWDFFEPGMLNQYDLILSCGDLSPRYLTFLRTMSRAEVLYVCGNHDKHYETTPPEGCVPIDGKLYDFYGLRILGLGGSMRYIPGAPCMYSEKEMKKRVRRLRFQLWTHKGFDILLTHAPAAGIHDEPDLPHQGFQCFVDLIDRYHPMYFFYGHIHRNYSGHFKRQDERNGTIIVNAYETYEIEIPDDLLPKWKNRMSDKQRIFYKIKQRLKDLGD